jgi:hypothetical protein
LIGENQKTYSTFVSKQHPHPNLKADPEWRPCSGGERAAAKTWPLPALDHLKPIEDLPRKACRVIFRRTDVID